MKFSYSMFESVFMEQMRRIYSEHSTAVLNKTTQKIIEFKMWRFLKSGAHRFGGQHNLNHIDVYVFEDENFNRRINIALFFENKPIKDIFQLYNILSGRRPEEIYNLSSE